MTTKKRGEKTGEKNGGKKRKENKDVLVATNVVASRPTGTYDAGSYQIPKKNPAHKNLNPAKIELIPAQLGKFLGSKVGQFWRSGGLRGPLRKSKMQKNFIPAQNIFISAQNILIPAQNITIQGNPVYYTTR